MFEQCPEVVLAQVFGQWFGVVFKHLNSEFEWCSNRVCQQCTDVNPQAPGRLKTVVISQLYELSAVLTASGGGDGTGVPSVIWSGDGAYHQ